jgi:hypothetical protein
VVLDLEYLEGVYLVAFVCTGRAGRPPRAQRLTRCSKESVRAFAKVDRRVRTFHILDTGVRSQVCGDRGRNSITTWAHGRGRVKPIKTIDRVNYITRAHLILDLKNLPQLSMSRQTTNPDGRVACLEPVWPSAHGRASRSLQFRVN